MTDPTIIKMAESVGRIEATTASTLREVREVAKEIDDVRTSLSSEIGGVRQRVEVLEHWRITEAGFSQGSGKAWGTVRVMASGLLTALIATIGWLGGMVWNGELKVERVDDTATVAPPVVTRYPTAF